MTSKSNLSFKTDKLMWEQLCFLFYAGRRFDMKGDERNWWSEETLEAFERKTKCLKNQYSNFTFDGGTVWQHIFLSSFPPYF